MPAPTWAKYVAVSALGIVIAVVTYVQSQPAISEATILAVVLIVVTAALKDVEAS
jgi:hypothetical protein